MSSFIYDSPSGRIPGIAGLGYGSKYRPEEIRALAGDAIARATGILIRTSSRMDTIQQTVTAGLLRGMGSDTLSRSNRQRMFFKDSRRVGELVRSLENLSTGDAYVDGQVAQYVNAVLGVSAAVRQSDRYGEPPVHGTVDPRYKRSTAHGEAASTVSRGSYEWGAYSNLRGGARAHGGYERDKDNTSSRIKNYSLSNLKPTSGMHIAYKPRNLGRNIFSEPNITGAVVGYAGGDKPVNYRPPSYSSRSGVDRPRTREIGQAAWRAGVSMTGEFRKQLHEPVKLAGGETLHVPWHVMGSADRFRGWLMEKYETDSKVKRLVDYSTWHKPPELVGTPHLAEGLAAAQRVASGRAPAQETKWGGKLEPNYTYKRNEFGDRTMQPLESPGTRGKFRDPRTGKRMVIGKMRGWADTLKMKIPYGQFRGMRVGDLLNPILKTYRNKKTGKRYTGQAHDAVYYIAGMKNSEYVKRSFPEFHSSIWNYFENNPAMREMLAPYENVNWSGGRSHRDLQIKFNPYKPSTWEHGMNVSLRDDDLPYYDRWDSYERGHRKGFDIRKGGYSRYDELRYNVENSEHLTPGQKVAKINELRAWEGEMGRPGDHDFGGYGNYQKQQSLGRKYEYGKLRGDKWDYSEEQGWVKTQTGDKEISYRDKRRAYWKKHYTDLYRQGVLNAGKVEDRPGAYDPQSLEREAEGEDGWEKSVRSFSGPSGRKRGRMSRGPKDPQSWEELQLSKLAWAKKMDWVVKNGGADGLRQLDEISMQIESDTPGGWAAVDYAQKILPDAGLVQKMEAPSYSNDPGAEIYETENSLRSYWFRSRALILAQQ